MEPDHGSPTPDLIAKLLAEPYRFSFFEAVRLLAQYEGEGPRIGYDGPPREERFRFRPELSLAFPKSDLTAIEVETTEDGERRYVIEVGFLGLYGASSPLPNYFTEELLQETEEDSLVRGFLDLFHHRMLSLLYRIWEKYRYYVQLRAEASDDMSERMYCLMGMGLTPHRGEAAVPFPHRLRYLGLLSRKPRSAEALRCLLEDYFDGLPVDVTSFATRTVPIPSWQQNKLGESGSALGEDLHVGDRLEDCAGHFRVSVGPVNREQFLGILPGTPAFEAFEELTRDFATDPLSFEVELILEQEEIPKLEFLERDQAPRLGYTSWLGPPLEDGRVVLREPFTVPRGTTSDEHLSTSAPGG